MKRVNAVIVGAGAGGGVVAKELATAGLSVVLLERGKWYTANDCRKDDLRNQRTTVLGNAFGPEDDGNPRVWVDAKGVPQTVLASEGGLPERCRLRGRWNAQLGRAGLAFYAPGLQDALHLRRAGGKFARRLAHLLRRPGAVLRESRIRDRHLRRLLGDSLSWPAPSPSAHAAAAAQS